MSQSSPNESQATQVLLRLQYQDLLRRGVTLPAFRDVEFRCFSQNGEDGILLYLFSLLGTTNRRVVEICAGDGLECNSANLVINHGWQGLMMDGDADNIARGRSFYATCRTTWVSPPTMVQAWITAENINELIRGNGFSGPVDLLSLDIDGNDYWVWKAIDVIEPRAVVLEFNPGLGPERRTSIAYDPDFRLDLTQQPSRCGASLAAFEALGRSKGYRLVGAQSFGFNAFFVRDGLGETPLPGITPLQCFSEIERLRSWNPGWLEALMTGPQAWVDV